MTTGSSGGFLLAFLAAFEVGDRVAMARPGYPCYRNVLTALGCEVVEIPTGPETRFQPTVEQVAELGDLKGLVVASPANPTGTMLLPSELAALATYCEEQQIQLITDEIYHGIEYAEPHLARSAWETSREAVVFSSFSKYFSMTGWRIGWMLVPDRLRRAVDVLTGNFTICPPVLAQWACLAAFSDASYVELDGHVARYADNRRLLLDGLPRLGITELAPADGAFYVYADVGHLTDDTMAFAHDLLRPHRRRRRTGHRLRHRRRRPVHPAQLRRSGQRHRGGPRAALHSARPLTFLHIRRPATLPVNHCRRGTRCTETRPGSGPWPTTCATRADDIRALADRLAARADRVPWQGLAADAMRPTHAAGRPRCGAPPACTTTPPTPSTGTPARWTGSRT